MKRYRKYGWMALAILPVAVSTTAHAKVNEAKQPIVKRVHDGKQLQVGDVVSQLRSELDEEGRVICVFDRRSTEVSVETEVGQEGGVSLGLDDQCRMTVIAIGPYEDASSPGGIGIQAPEVSK